MANETGSAGRPEGPAPAANQENAATEQADERSSGEQSAADQQLRPGAPVPDVEDLERLRTRLIAKYHGRRK